ncbi:hypothetical protein TUM19329_13150 [Legionella antarctica]|uniref:Arsenate reductase n=1 Tax=Legionella antarctica TaxID=2708020 RepID=A0A6F8T2P5_9GAMM|nr:ArsC/Spx/MgsR family protein [Legionella antarctica]BCA94954.1 hypothetical protein TUM19329_13150 [Legionella antarctica]
MEQLIVLRSHFALSEFVRTNERFFKESGLSLNDETSVLQAMLTEPLLMQRPIITFNGKAIIGRPPEKVLELFN